MWLLTLLAVRRRRALLRRFSAGVRIGRDEAAILALLDQIDPEHSPYPGLAGAASSGPVRLENVGRRVLDPGGAVRIRCSSVVPDRPAMAGGTETSYRTLPTRTAPHRCAAAVPGGSGLGTYLAHSGGPDHRYRCHS